MQDRRVRKTKVALKAALVKLLNEKQLEQISTTELCKMADINRSTFYNYYSNPQECFEEYSFELIVEVKQFLTSKKIVSIEEFLSKYLAIMKDNQEIFRSIHRSSIHNPIIMELVRDNNLCKEYMANLSGNQEMLLSYFLHGFFGIVSEWLECGCREEIDEIIEVCLFMDRNIKNNKNDESVG